MGCPSRPAPDRAALSHAHGQRRRAPRPRPRARRRWDRRAAGDSPFLPQPHHLGQQRPPRPRHLDQVAEPDAGHGRSSAARGLGEPPGQPERPARRGRPGGAPAAAAGGAVRSPLAERRPEGLRRGRSGRRPGRPRSPPHVAGARSGSATSSRPGATLRLRRHPPVRRLATWPDAAARAAPGAGRRPEGAAGPGTPPPGRPGAPGPKSASPSPRQVDHLHLGARQPAPLASASSDSRFSSSAAASRRPRQSLLAGCGADLAPRGAPPRLRLGAGNELRGPLAPSTRRREAPPRPWRRAWPAFSTRSPSIARLQAARGPGGAAAPRDVAGAADARTVRGRAGGHGSARAG